MFRSVCLRYAMLAAPPAALVGLIVPLFLLNGLDNVAWFTAPQTAELSVGAVCILLSIVIAFPICVIAYRLYSHLRDDLTNIEKVIERGRQDWIGRLAVSFAVMFLVAVACALTFWLIGNAFTNARITYLAAALVCAAYAGALGFGVAYYIAGLGERNLLGLVGAFAGVGLFISFLVAQDDEWWRDSVSILGYDPGSGMVFNVTVILVGLLALTFARDLIDDLEVLHKMGHFPLNSFRLIRVGLTLICLGIVGIGVFPTRVTAISTFLHHLFAHIMIIMFMLGMFALDRIAPNIYPASFIRFSRICGAICAVSLVAYYILGIINFVALELILFITFGTWIYVFNRYTKNYIQRQNPQEIRQALLGIRRAL
ncbi:MAG: hypothetical protein HZC41_18810 [Chloroflexi bacterium]|nr:hypothetical protein [Chloroflexota bacterium]